MLAGGLWAQAPKTNAIKWDRAYPGCVLIWQGPLWTQHGDSYRLMQGPWEVCRPQDKLVVIDGRLQIERG